MTIELSEAQTTQFREDGFLIMEKLIEPEAAAATAARYEPLFGGELETGIMPDEFNYNPERPDLTRQICNGWKSDLTIARTTFRADIGRACARLGGWPGARLQTDNILWKPPGARPLGFHQDSSYLQWMTPSDMMSCWIALDPATEESGTMLLVRGSHRWAKSPMARQFHGPEDFMGEMYAAAAKEGVEPEVVPVEVPRGGGSFHHGWVWHGSGFNRSRGPRRTHVVHTISSETRYAANRIGEGTGRIYGRYKRFADDRMDESYFPVLWTEDGRRTPFLDDYVRGGGGESALGVQV